jgi:hypothetical protein
MHEDRAATQEAATRFPEVDHEESVQAAIEPQDLVCTESISQKVTPIECCERTQSLRELHQIRRFLANTKPAKEEGRRERYACSAA